MTHLTGQCDVVTFSYSLTMIPDWRAALDNAMRLLKPGGHICVADFTVTKDQSWFTRKFWQTVFATDNVHPNEEHIPTLQSMFQEVNLKVASGGFPYVPMCIKSPYYFFIGQKEGGASVGLSSNSSVTDASNSGKTTVRKRVRKKSKARSK